MYFKRSYNRVAHFASKNQLTGLSVSGTLGENGLMIQMIKKMVLWRFADWNNTSWSAENIWHNKYEVLLQKPKAIKFCKDKTKINSFRK